MKRTTIILAILAFMATFAYSAPISTENSDDGVSYVVSIDSPVKAGFEMNVPAFEAFNPEPSENVVAIYFSVEETVGVSDKHDSQKEPPSVRRLQFIDLIIQENLARSVKHSNQERLPYIRILRCIHLV